MRKFLRKCIDTILGPYLSSHSKYEISQIPALNKQLQILLQLKYQELHRAHLPLPSFDEVEFRSFSQNGEDGILLLLFSLIGATNKKSIELCVGNGIESITANLITHHGFKGLLFDGDEKNIRTANEFYARGKDTFISPPKTVHTWIDAGNVNRLIAENKYEGVIDLLALDMDGIDFWIWKAITCVTPRVVVLEYHEELGYEAITVPYNAQFKKGHTHPRYFGASLPAFCKLAKEKGYRLVGCNRQKFNAFFLRYDTGTDIFPEIPFAQCMRHPDPQHYTLASDTLKQYPLAHV